MKRFLLLLLIVGMLAGGGWWYLSRQPVAPVVVDSISERSQAFISEQQGTGAGLWSEVDFTADMPVATRSSIVTQCFSVQLPAAVNTKVSEDEEDCRVEARTLDPRLLVVVSSSSRRAWSDETGIIFRRSQPDVFQEQSLTQPPFTQSVLFQASDSITAFGWYSPQVVTVSATGMSQVTPRMTEVVTEIFSSITFP